MSEKPKRKLPLVVAAAVSLLLWEIIIASFRFLR